MITILQIIQVLLDVVATIIVIQVVLSWLVAFNVISLGNPTVRSIWRGLERLTDPLYRPIRRLLPDTGALDLAPLAVLLIIYILRNIVIPNLAAWWIGPVIV